MCVLWKLTSSCRTRLSCSCKKRYNDTWISLLSLTVILCITAFDITRPLRCYTENFVHQSVVYNTSPSGDSRDYVKATLSKILEFVDTNLNIRNNLIKLWNSTKQWKSNFLTRVITYKFFKAR